MSKRNKWEGRIEARQEIIFEDIKEIKVLIMAFTKACDVKRNALDKRIDDIGREVTAVKTKATIYGTLVGGLMGFISSFFKR